MVVNSNYSEANMLGCSSFPQASGRPTKISKKRKIVELDKSSSDD